MDYIQIAIETTTEAVEAISAFLIGKGVGGVEIEDPKDILFHPKGPASWDYMDEDLIKGNKDTVIIKAYFLESTDLKELIPTIQSGLEKIKQHLDIGEGKISFNKVEHQDWSTEWKKHYKTLEIGNNIVIKPTWKDYISKDKDDIIIEMDPGMAFGTGTHETTSMCIELIEEHFKPSDKVLDVGTGSGILSIIASKLGADRVFAVDLNEDAVKIAKKNADMNNCKDLINIRHGDLLDIVQGKFDIVVANIIADAIIPLSETVSRVMTEDGLFISSGIIDDRIDDVVKALEENFEILEIRRQNEWAAIIAKIKR